MPSKDISIIIRIEGGIADDGMLDVYDAADTISGIARSINIIAHAFGNDEKIRKQGQAAHGSHTYIHSSKKGCFEERIDVRFDEKICSKIGGSIISNAFWDYLSWTWSYTLGEERQPTTPYVRKIAEKKDLFVDEVANVLESPIHDMHKSISRDNNVKVYINRPKVGDILTLNTETLDYVTTREERAEQEYIIGNITRTSVTSHFGRLFSDEENRILSFEFANQDDRRAKDLALRSMREYNQGLDGKFHLKVSKILNARGTVKRYIVHDLLEIRK
ncbi:hypothetical protein M2R28_06830 [Aeromonas hydrophila]|uniref:DUF7946 domain-containing protein n=1 Tax=Aeromonas TaxID=642 RepID=UPI001F4BEEF4|nr:MULTISPECIES: hypothetical protein [Aeromonas]MCO4199403.1 hypothetical protein [Aeromonas hydrophila]MDN6868671.1 hypothetical protein [Aeromonas caviae]UNB60422.1 hypothetical protein MKW86_10195 [Aeromonas hydrophila]